MDVIFQYTFQLLYIKACVLFLMMLQIHEQTCVTLFNLWLWILKMNSMCHRQCTIATASSKLNFSAVHSEL